MWNSLNSISTSSDLAKGKKFLEKLQYVQHVDKRKNKASEISEQTLQHLLADISKVDGHDSNSTENVKNSESNLDILKSSLKDRIVAVCVWSNPLPISLVSSPGLLFHAFVGFVTQSKTSTNSKKKTMCWSLEKNGKCIVLQQSTQMDDVFKKIYDHEENQIVRRHRNVKGTKFVMGNSRPLEDLLRVIFEYNLISERYHLLFSNCQNFASFIFEKLNGERENWSTYLSAIVDLLRGKKKTAIELNAIMYKSMVNDDKFDFYRALMEGKRKDFKKLIKNLSIKTINSVDSQGYTLLEWATVYSTSDWPIDEELKEKGAEITSKTHRCAKIRSNKRLFRRNVFFIALQYLPPNQKSKLFDSIDKFDIHGVNGTGDTALHLALYGKKWEIAEEILPKLKNYDVNTTNIRGETPLHLAAKLNCEFGLFKKILNRTNKKNINKADGDGCTALHYAIDKQSNTKVEELLSHKDVNVNIENHEDNSTALHLALKWPNIPADLFQMILEKSTSDTINTRDINGYTVLDYAILTKSETAVKELYHKDVTNNQIALHCACICENFPMDLFKIILEKSTDINAQDQYGETALHYAIGRKCRTKVEELLTHTDVNVNVKDNGNLTALHLACLFWKDIPMDLFKIILNKSTDINAQGVHVNTALHFAIMTKSETAVKELLKHKDVDVNVANNQNDTALHLASKWKDIPMDLFQIILNKSTDINARNKNGNTALHYAVFNNFQKAIKVLLKDDRVDVKIENNENRTALHFSIPAWGWNKILIDWLQMFKIKFLQVLRLKILGKIVIIILIMYLILLFRFAFLDS